MWADCHRTAALSLPRQKEGAKFKSPPYLLPTYKGRQPFELVAIDSVVGLTPPAPDGATNVLLCVDSCSRFIEGGRVPSLSSYGTAIWFHENITCCYGLPAVVRSERGPEYRGAFD